ncbi:MAG: 50S ribosomal protein L29 [Bryobacterales bacterium]|jgi:large subunit ribosomal protein L29
MKAGNFRDLDGDELAAKEREAREQLFRLRFQIQMGQSDGLKKYRALKKDLARILTVRRETELARKS